MSRRFLFRTGPTPAPRNPTPPVSGSLLVERILLGCLTAIIVARAIIANDDPNRLRLTSGAGPLTLNVLTFALLVAWAIWRALTRKPLTRGHAWIVVVGLAVVSGLAFASADAPNRYAHPGWFAAWDWMACACLSFLTWQLASTAAIARGLIAVFLATAACSSVQALYQKAAREFAWRSAETPPSPPSAMTLAGDDEFGLKLNHPHSAANTFRATFDRPDTLAGYLLLLLPAAIYWGICGWRARGWAKFAIILPIVLAIGVTWSVFSWLNAIPVSLNEWHSAKEMIANNPELGVGPGNLSRHAGSAATNHLGFWSSLAATNGLIATTILVVMMIVVGTIAVCRRRRIEFDDDNSRKGGPRWEFYQGGVAGLLLGMILATGDIPAEADASEMLRLGVVAAGRTVVWFAVIGLLENVAVNSRTLIRCVTPGVAIVAALGIVSAGFHSPALQWPFWMALALMLIPTGFRLEPKPAIRPLTWVAAAVAMALAVANIAHVYIPGVITASSVRTARAASKEFPHAHWKTQTRNDLDHIEHVHRADDFIAANILRPLRRALEHDPENSALMVELARWNRWHWLYYQELRYDQNAKEIGQQSLKLAERADQVDSRNPAGKLSQYETLLTFASPPFVAKPAQLAGLEKVIGQIAETQPEREVPLRYRVVLTLMENRPPKLDAVETWALWLLKLDSGKEAKHGKLTPDQRSRLIGRLKQVIQRPSMELAEFLVGG